MKEDAQPKTYQRGNKWQKDRYSFMSVFNQNAGITEFATAKNGKQRYFHLLTDKDQLYNFLCEQTILDEVNKRKTDHKLGDDDRLRTNTVASQPCCFNLFVPLKIRLDLASQLFSKLMNKDIQIQHIEIEFTPNSQSSIINGFEPAFDESLGDQSKIMGTDADVAVFYSFDNNTNRGVILIEFKYIEPAFSVCGSYKKKKLVQPKCDKPDFYEMLIAPYIDKPIKRPECGYLKYKNWELTRDSKVFDHKAIKNYGKCPFRYSVQQIWRNLLLAEHVAHSRNLNEFYFWVLCPSENVCLWQQKDSTDVEAELRKVLLYKRKNLFSRMDIKKDFVDVIKSLTLNDWERKWITKFEKRYIPKETKLYDLKDCRGS